MKLYLEFRMKEKGVSRADLQKLLGISEKTLRNKLNGTSDFTWSEAKAIRGGFFPDDDYEQLFTES